MKSLRCQVQFLGSLRQIFHLCCLLRRCWLACSSHIPGKASLVGVSSIHKLRTSCFFKYFVCKTLGGVGSWILVLKSKVRFKVEGTFQPTAPELVIPELLMRKKVVTGETARSCNPCLLWDWVSPSPDVVTVAAPCCPGVVQRVPRTGCVLHPGVLHTVLSLWKCEVLQLLRRKHLYSDILC